MSELMYLAELEESGWIKHSRFGKYHNLHVLYNGKENALQISKLTLSFTGLFEFLLAFGALCNRNWLRGSI